MATSGEVVTYREFEDRANQMAHLYRAQGLKRLDHVSFLFENNPRMLECEAGAERSGLYTCISCITLPTRRRTSSTTVSPHH
jgi:long-chain acyl-CoA synthetase